MPGTISFYVVAEERKCEKQRAISYTFHISMLYYPKGGASMATLLIVEDDHKTNEAICEYLKPAGHTVIPAYDGSEALQLFRQNSIDLVVLDIKMDHILGNSVYTYFGGVL